MNNTLEQRAEGSIVYRFATPIDPKSGILYVNVIPNYECSNHCTFCSRGDAIKGLPNIYEKKAGTSLYLSKAPTVEGVVNAVEQELQKKKTKEIAFVGLGEPLLQYPVIRDSIAGIRHKGFKGKIRIDTNGQLKCWSRYAFGCYEKFDVNNVRGLKEAGLDEAWVSLNARCERDYERICQPQFEDAWQRVMAFIDNCKKEKIKVKLSFVVGGDPSIQFDDYVEFAKSLGIKRKNIILRKYVPPINTI